MRPIVYDLTRELNQDTPIFPGDPEYKLTKVSCINSGDTYNLHKLEFGNHTGTHIDFPYHISELGKTSSDFSINDLISDVTIVDCGEKSNVPITKSFLENQNNICRGEFIFFKNSTFLELDAA